MMSDHTDGADVCTLLTATLLTRKKKNALLPDDEAAESILQKGGLW